jgi:hypothetical protein
VTTHLNRTVSLPATARLSTEHAITRLATTRTRTRDTRTTSTRTETRTTTRQTQTTTTAPAKFLTVADSFAGGLIDPTIWYTGCCAGTGASVAERNGVLEFAFAPGTTTGGAYDNAGGNVGTQCKFPGDFDARVDFNLAQWPAANGVEIMLWGVFGPTNIGAGVQRMSSAAYGETYSTWLGARGGGSVSLPETSGSLRIARKKGLLTTYFLHNGKWQSLGSRSFGSLAASIIVGASVGSGKGTSFGGQQVVVDFDNFTVTGANPICPAGSQPPGS